MEKIVNYFGKWYILTEDSTGVELKELDENRSYTITDKNENARTIKQNSSLYLYFTKLADELNKAGCTFTKVVSDKKLYKMDIDWSKILIKENLWRPIQKAMLDKKSTTKLKKDEIEKIYNNLNRYTSERLGISVSFPSEDEIIFKQLYKGGQNG